MERWSGRVAVVTGASAGIGADIAKQLAIKGMQVVGLARRKERVEELAKQLPKDCKGELIPYKCDIADEKQVKETFEWVDENLGGISVMINNAGVARWADFAGNDSTEGWKQILDTNVYGMSLCSRHAVHSMRKHNIDDGQFININSNLGHILPSATGAAFTMYIASKHAMRILSDGLRKEVASLKTNIRVANLCPGYVKTEIIEASNAPQEVREHLKIRPGLDPEDITDIVVHILSAPQKVNGSTKQIAVMKPSLDTKG